MENTKSKKGFNYAMLALLVFAFAFVCQLFSPSDSVFFPLVIGVAALVACIVAIMGLILSVQGLREPISMEQIVGTSVNGVFFVLFIYIIVEVISKLN